MMMIMMKMREYLSMQKHASFQELKKPAKINMDVPSIIIYKMFGIKCNIELHKKTAFKTMVFTTNFKNSVLFINMNGKAIIY